MIWLDAHLSPRVARRIQESLVHEARALRDLGLRDAEDVEVYERGNLTQRNGLQVAGTTQSTQYPMFEFAAKDPGEAGNKLAVKLYPALSKDIVPFPSHLLNDAKLFPFYFQMVQLVDTLTGKTNSVLNSFGAQYSRFVSKKGGIDTSSGATVDMAKVLPDQYIDLDIDVASGLGTGYIKTGSLSRTDRIAKYNRLIRIEEKIV